MACARTPTCQLFKAFNLKATLGIWKVFYCEDRFERCERLKLLESGAEVPRNMLPNGKRLDVDIDVLCS